MARFISHCHIQGLHGSYIGRGLESDVEAGHHTAEYVNHHIDHGPSNDVSPFAIRNHINIGNGGVDFVAGSRPKHLGIRRTVQRPDVLVVLNVRHALAKRFRLAIFAFVEVHHLPIAGQLFFRNIRKIVAIQGLKAAISIGKRVSLILQQVSVYGHTEQAFSKLINFGSDPRHVSARTPQFLVFGNPSLTLAPRVLVVRQQSIRHLSPLPVSPG